MLPYQFLLPKLGRSCNCNKLWSITAGTVSRFPVSFTQVLQLLPCTTEQASLLSQCKKAQSSKTNKLRIGSIFFLYNSGSKMTSLQHTHTDKYPPYMCLFIHTSPVYGNACQPSFRLFNNLRQMPLYTILQKQE